MEDSDGKDRLEQTDIKLKNSHKNLKKLLLTGRKEDAKNYIDYIIKLEDFKTESTVYKQFLEKGIEINNKTEHLKNIRGLWRTAEITLRDLHINKASEEEIKKQKEKIKKLKWDFEDLQDDIDELEKD